MLQECVGLLTSLGMQPSGQPGKHHTRQPTQPAADIPKEEPQDTAVTALLNGSKQLLEHQQHPPVGVSGVRTGTSATQPVLPGMIALPESCELDDPMSRADAIATTLEAQMTLETKATLFDGILVCTRQQQQQQQQQAQQVTTRDLPQHQLMQPMHHQSIHHVQQTSLQQHANLLQQHSQPSAQAQSQQQQPWQSPPPQQQQLASQQQQQLQQQHNTNGPAPKSKQKAHPPTTLQLLPPHAAAKALGIKAHIIWLSCRIKLPNVAGLVRSVSHALATSDMTDVQSEFSIDQTTDVCMPPLKRLKPDSEAVINADVDHTMSDGRHLKRESAVESVAGVNGAHIANTVAAIPDASCAACDDTAVVVDLDTAVLKWVLQVLSTGLTPYLRPLVRELQPRSVAVRTFTVSLQQQLCKQQQQQPLDQHQQQQGQSQLQPETSQLEALQRQHSAAAQPAALQSDQNDVRTKQQSDHQQGAAQHAGEQHILLCRWQLQDDALAQQCVALLQQAAAHCL